MHKSTALVVLLALVADPSSAQHNCYPKSACKAECEETKQNIRKIQQKMRQGYSASQGARMEAELRRLRALRAKLCR